MWQIHFMLWNEVRPDCWYPVIRYRDETGKERFNTFDYGGFRHSWNVGETVEIAGFSYSSGTPCGRTLDIWRRTAPSIDLFAPDIYQEKCVCH